MKREHSAGGVVYRKFPISNDPQHQSVQGKQFSIKWLVGKHSGYHKWVLPKGLIEVGESPVEAAIREVDEETGIRAKIIGKEPVHVEEYEYQADFSEGNISHGGVERRVMTYQESGGKQEWVKKDVTFFLMEYVSGDTKDHSFEMEEVEWLEYDQAIERLEFDGERQALLRAREEVELI